MSLSAVTPCTGIMRLCDRSVTRSAPVTAGNDDPFVFVSGAAGVVEGGDIGGNSDLGGTLSYVDTSDGAKLIVSDPVPRE